MNYLEFELSKTRSKNSQCWMFAVFYTTVIMNFSLTCTAEYWGIWTTIIFYTFILICVIVFMVSALYFSYKIKKLEITGRSKFVG